MNIRNIHHVNSELGNSSVEDIMRQYEEAEQECGQALQKQQNVLQECQNIHGQTVQIVTQEAVISIGRDGKPVRSIIKKLSGTGRGNATKDHHKNIRNIAKQSAINAQNGKGSIGKNQSKKLKRKNKVVSKRPKGGSR